MATIRKRNGIWQVQVRKAGQPAVTRSFASIADARRWASQTDAAAERAELQGDLGVLRRTTLGDLLIRYREDIAPRLRSRDTLSYQVGVLLRHRLSSLSLAALRREDIVRFRDESLTDRSGETVRQYLVLLRQVLELARREWGFPLAVNPVDLVRRPAGSKARTRRLEPGEAERLFVELSQLRTPWMIDLVGLAIETGMRRSELLGLTWSQIDLTSQIVHLPTTKNGTARTVPLTPQAKRILEVIKGRPGDTQRPFPVSANAVKLAWMRLCRRAGIGDLRFHDLRREAVSRFFELGLSVPEVALISGHKDVRMLMRYTHLRADHLARKLSVLTSPDRPMSEQT